MRVELAGVIGGIFTEGGAGRFPFRGGNDASHRKMLPSKQHNPRSGRSRLGMRPTESACRWTPKFDDRWRGTLAFDNSNLGHLLKNRGERLSVLRDGLPVRALSNYGLFVPFFGAAFLGAGLAFFFAAPSLPPISVKASAALNGNWRTEDWPVVLKVTSTRRLLASRIVLRFLRDRCLSSGVTSGLFSTACFTSSSFRLRCLP
jgi:hypothetical protein